MGRRVVMTGIGVRAPGGNGTAEFWRLLTSGRTATRAISFFDASPYRSRVAGEIDFEPESEGLSRDEVCRMDRATQLAVTCAREAVVDSGLDLTTLDPTGRRQPGQCGGRRYQPGTAIPGRIRPWPTVARRPQKRVAAHVRLPDPCRDAGRSGLDGRCRRAGHHGLQRMHIRHRFRRTRMSADSGRQR